MKRKNLPTRAKFVVGIDEVGRGPLAGPVAVAAFRMPAGFDARAFGPVRDSKKLSPRRREEIAAELARLKRAGAIDYAVRFRSAAAIDRRGITRAIRACLAAALDAVGASPSDRILLDGGLRAPETFAYQQTIIKGDEQECAIAFASITAKVARDRLMVRLAARYPAYGFDIHKGYGTAAHRRAVGKHGLSPIHRRSFCANARREADAR